MFPYLYIFFCLIGSNNGDDKKITECAEVIGSDTRPSVPPEYRHDLDSPECSALFPKESDSSYENNPKM